MYQNQFNKKKFGLAKMDINKDKPILQKEEKKRAHMIGLNWTLLFSKNDINQQKEVIKLTRTEELIRLPTSHSVRHCVTTIFSQDSPSKPFENRLEIYLNFVSL